MKSLFKILVVFGLLISTQVNGQSEKTIEGEKFDSKIKTSEGTVYLKGGGLREKYTIDLYVACLYLPKTYIINGGLTPTKVCIGDDPMAIDIKIVSRRVTRDKFVDSVKDGFENASEGFASSEQISEFKACFPDAFNDGDRIRIIYVPSAGTKVFKNGEFRGVIKGLKFKQALFSIWLGEDPADYSLKDDLMGDI